MATKNIILRAITLTGLLYLAPVLGACALLAGVYDQDYAWQRLAGTTDPKVASARLMNCELANPGAPQSVDRCMREQGYHKVWSDVAPAPPQAAPAAAQAPPAARPAAPASMGKGAL
jgi:hypothetical protein